ncbi:hypothetical protein JCM10207_000945 [Rhodosporidiobolus poonsookiae]
MAPPTTGQRQSILPLFPLLSSHQLATRLDAAHQLLTALPLTQHLSSDPDTPYALKRLIAGLASSNEAARQGFAVALTQLVASLPDERAQHVLPQLVEATASKAGMDSREERDMLFARLMGLHALVRSGILTRPDGPASNQGESWQEVVQALVALGNKKSWIREPAYWVVCEALRTLLEAQAEWKDECVRWAVQRLVNDAREKAKGWGPEKVAIVLVLQSYGVDADWTSVLAPTFPSASLLSRSSLSALASALKGSASSAAAEPASGPKQGVNAVKTSKGAAAPAPGQAPHFVWTMLRGLYFPAEGVKVGRVADKAKFADFWKVCVDQALFSSPSHPLKSLGFSLISLFLPSLSASELPSLFGANTLRVFANHLRLSAGAGGGEKTLSRVADKLAASTLPAYLATERGAPAALPLLKLLTAPPHSAFNAFEPKVLERFVARLPLAGVRGWVAHLQGEVLAPSAATDEVEGGEELEVAEREKRVTAQRSWALDQLLHVGKNGGVQKDEEVVRGLLEFLAVVGWFEVTKEGSKGARSYIPTPAFTPTQRAAARSRFFSVLTALLTAPATPAASTATSAVSTVAGGAAWLARALALLDNLAADDKHFARADPDDEEDEDEDESELVDRVKALYAALSAPAAPAKQDKKKGKKRDSLPAAAAEPESDKEQARRAVARAFVEGVRLVVWDEGASDAHDVLEGAVDAVEALFPALASPASASKAAAAPENDEDEDAEAPEPTTILVDVLLALLRRQSAFVKTFAGAVVLKGFADEVGAQAVELLVEQVRVEEEVVEPAADGEDAEMADATAPTKSGKKAQPDAAESDDDEDSDDDSDAGFEVDEAFKNELLAALEAGGMGVPNGAEGSDDESDEEEEGSKEGKDGESDEEELLDDDAMLELDERLADIFRANGGGRRSKKRDRTDDLHYRIRCLDLLDILAHAKPSSSLLVPVYAPLFTIIRTATPVEAELQNKAAKLLRFLVQPRKAASTSTAATGETSDATAAAALDALEELHTAAASVDNGDLAPLCAPVALALVKAAVSAAPLSAPAAVSRIFADSFEAYLVNKNAKTRCQPLLTTEVAKRAPAAAWGIREKAIELATSEKCNAFRRAQAFDVVQTLVASYAALKTPESKSAVLAFLPSYRLALYTTISTSLTATTSTSSTFDAARLKLLAKQALSAARLTVQLSSQSTAADVWSPAEWAALADPTKVSDRFKGATGVLRLVKQLVGVLGGQVDDAKKAGAVAGAKKDKKRKAAAMTDDGATAPAQAQATPSKGKKAKASAPAPATPASKPEEEVQDESVAVRDGDDEAGDVSMAVDGEAATPSGKKGKRKEKKKRRESAGGKA